MSNHHISVVTYQVAADDRIVMVDDEWIAFATANDAMELSRQRVLGHSVFDFVAGVEVQALYRMLLARVRATGRAAIFPFRCDSPSKRRHMIMHMRPESDNSVNLTCITTRIEARNPIRLLDRHVPRTPSQSIERCSNCNRVRVPDGGWMEVEEALSRLEWLNREEQPFLVHTVCGQCRLVGREDADAV